MAAHRADNHLVQSLRSLVLAMHRHSAELVVVANGPEREEVAALVQAHASDVCLRVVLSELPSLAHALNRGIEVASGDYIARFDADDLCLPERFTVQLAQAGASGADFLFGAARDMDAAGRATGRCRVSNTRLWNRCGPVHPTAFVRRSALVALGGYGQLDASEDYHLWLRASAAGCRLVTESQAVIAYRVHGAQSTSTRQLAVTFATNAGLKLTQALRQGSPALFAGVLLDLGRYCYRRCANAFS